MPAATSTRWTVFGLSCVHYEVLYTHRNFKIDSSKEDEMMVFVEVIGFVLFVVLTIIGYKKSNRNMMLMASLCLLLAVAGPDFIAGFNDGFSDSVTS